MFPAAGLGVAVASDGVVYQTDVYSASHGPLQPRRLRHSWGNLSGFGSASMG
jgi:cysteine protease ATG4